MGLDPLVDAGPYPEKVADGGTDSQQRTEKDGLGLNERGFDSCINARRGPSHQDS